MLMCAALIVLVGHIIERNAIAIESLGESNCSSFPLTAEVSTL